MPRFARSRYQRRPRVDLLEARLPPGDLFGLSSVPVLGGDWLLFNTSSDHAKLQNADNGGGGIS
jgi:hypothetical protein